MKIIRNKYLDYVAIEAYPNNWWMILKCSTEITRYYRSLANIVLRTQFQLSSPPWDAHITIVRDERPNNIDKWAEWNGQKFSYLYQPDNIKTDGEYFWIPVIAPELLNIRTQLGLPNPSMPLHLTFGRRQL